MNIFERFAIMVFRKECAQELAMIQNVVNATENRAYLQQKQHEKATEELERLFREQNETISKVRAQVILAREGLRDSVELLNLPLLGMTIPTGDATELVSRLKTIADRLDTPL